MNFSWDKEKFHIFPIYFWEINAGPLLQDTSTGSIFKQIQKLHLANREGKVTVIFNTVCFSKCQNDFCISLLEMFY